MFLGYSPTGLEEGLHFAFPPCFAAHVENGQKKRSDECWIARSQLAAFRLVLTLDLNSSLSSFYRHFEAIAKLDVTKGVVETRVSVKVFPLWHTRPLPDRGCALFCVSR